MKNYLKSKNQMQSLSLILGIFAVIFYFLHVIIGKALYPGYNSISQAISDLTADGAPSHQIASSLANVFAIFSVSMCFVLCLFVNGKMNRLFRIGVYTFTAMNLTSAIGYAFFPLSESGFAGEFQDIMHGVVTGIVVLLTIISFILVTIGLKKSKQYKLYYLISILSIILLFGSSMAMGIIPMEYFGIVERISVYTVVLYNLFLSTFVYFYPSNDIIHDSLT